MFYPWIYTESPSHHRTAPISLKPCHSVRKSSTQTWSSSKCPIHYYRSDIMTSCLPLPTLNLLPIHSPKKTITRVLQEGCKTAIGLQQNTCTGFMELTRFSVIFSKVKIKVRNKTYVRHIIHHHVKRHC